MTGKKKRREEGKFWNFLELRSGTQFTESKVFRKRADLVAAATSSGGGGGSSSGGDLIAGPAVK